MPNNIPPGGNTGDPNDPHDMGNGGFNEFGEWVWHDNSEGARESPPVFASPTNVNLRAMINSVSRDRVALSGDRRASLLSQLTSEQRARQRAGGETAGRVAQAGGPVPANFSGALDNALRRTKMRSRVQTMGDAAAEQQGLRDRINVAKASRTREGELINAAGRQAQINEGVNIATADANQMLKEGRFGLAGTIAGAGLARAMDGKGFGEFFGGIFGSGGGGGGIDLQTPPGAGGVGA